MEFADCVTDAQKLAPALAGGNAVDVEARGSDAVDVAGARAHLREAGVPKGVISVLPGKGSVIGDVLVRHPLVKKVSFTGGTEVGRGIARVLQRDKLMPVSLANSAANRRPSFSTTPISIPRSTACCTAFSVRRAKRASRARVCSCSALS